MKVGGSEEEHEAHAGGVNGTLFIALCAERDIFVSNTFFGVYISTCFRGTEKRKMHKAN